MRGFWMIIVMWVALAAGVMGAERGAQPKKAPSRGARESKPAAKAPAKAKPRKNTAGGDARAPGAKAKTRPAPENEATLGKSGLRAEALKILAGHGVRQVVFAVRGTHPEHWYANFGYYSTDDTNKLYDKGGKLCLLDLASGKVTTLLDDPEGAVRDPVLDYDGRTVIFSWRKGGTEQFHLYDMTIPEDSGTVPSGMPARGLSPNPDGSRGSGTVPSGMPARGLSPIPEPRQLTSGPYDDLEPCPLPDGGIVFVSSRCRRWVNCWLSQVANLHRCDRDGSNIRPLSANIEHDNTPWVLPDGRILYMRWEYIDRNQVNYHHLWTMNPDGTGQTVFFGNFHPGGVFLDAKPIPGSRSVVLSHSPGHGRFEHCGQVAVIDPRHGPDDLNSLTDLTKDANFRDPWALDGDHFLAAKEGALYLVARAPSPAASLATELCRLPAGTTKDVWLHEPRPLAPREREPVIPPRVNLAQPTGRLLLSDVTRGRNMEGVARGEIRQLLVIESLPKPVNFTGGMDPLSYVGTFTLERVLGTVPVEADGSAYFEAPALRSLLFVALDGRGRAVKRMQSFTSVEPGETLGCIGCHESRTMTGPAAPPQKPLAAQRPPSRIEPVAGAPDVLDFPRDIQPILDRHCLKCHGPDKRRGGVLLSGDRGPMFSNAYYTLVVWGQVADGRNLARSNYPPRALGSGGSALMRKLEAHHGVMATDAEKRTVALWLDSGAPYPGTYAALGTGMIGGYQKNQQVLENDQDWPESKAAAEAFARRCAGCHNEKERSLPQYLSDEAGLSFWQPKMDDPRLKRSRHIVYDLTLPEKSLILKAPLAPKAGGFGLCKKKTEDRSQNSKSGNIFMNTADPDYQKILAMVEAGKKKLEEIKRFDMPGFQPRPEYVREMKRFGILPAGVNPGEIDIYALDRKYWDSFIWTGSE